MPEDDYFLGCCAVIIPLIMKAESISETSVNFYQTTRRNIPEGSHHHTRHRENLKSQLDACQIPLSKSTSQRLLLSLSYSLP
jgi:hypothetical protein